jgi:16S rRNA (guanine1207-N2)-methyltransferase
MVVSKLHSLLNQNGEVIRMSEHYYSSQPTSGHQIQEFTATLRGVSLRLRTDAGVFSKNRLDSGTALLIEALPLSPDLRSVFDLGCGYGPIGLTVAKLLPQAAVAMSDINQRATELAAHNAAANGITNVTIRTGEGFTPFAGLRFDLIVTNPPIRAGKQVIYPLVDQALHALNPGGSFVAVILTRQGAKSLERKMADVFGNVRELEKGGGYRVVQSVKTGAELPGSPAGPASAPKLEE